MPKRPATLLIILALLFGVPLFGAFFLFKEKDPLSSHTTNHGTLINPPLDLATLDLKDEQSQPILEKAWKGKWLMLYVNTADHCDAQCDKNLYHMRQIKTATGKDGRRVARAIVTFSSAAPDQHLRNVLDIDFAGTMHFVVGKSELARFISRSRNDNTVRMTTPLQNLLFLVDPLGNVMMVYPEDTPPMNIFKDLSRLLKLSHIG